MTGTVWHASGASKFEWAHWDDESVLFDGRSGQTHLLTATAAEALIHLQADSCDAQQLAALLAETFRVPLDRNLADQVEELLAQLSELGLVEPRTD